MRFLAPSFLLWAGLLVPVALLFLLRRRPPTVRVSSLSLFDLEPGTRATLRPRRLRELLAFLLAATTVLLAVGALARPAWPPPAEAGAASTPPAPITIELQQPRGGGDPFVRTALLIAAERLGLRVGTAESRTPPRARAVVPGLGAIVFDPRGTVPGQASDLPKEGLRIERIHAVAEEHPILAGVASDRLALTQTNRLVPGGGHVLWEGPAGPLLVAHDDGRERVVTMAFSPERSERLGLSASYPVLVSNALQWVLAAAGPEASPQAASTSGLSAGLLWIVLGLLVLEAWLFHRRGWS